jgi:hypothetical protein
VDRSSRTSSACAEALAFAVCILLGAAQFFPQKAIMGKSARKVNCRR